jgi:hypothetical protein
MSSLGIDPATIRLVALCPNRLRYHPPELEVIEKKSMFPLDMKRLGANKGPQYTPGVIN